MKAQETEPQHDQIKVAQFLSIAIQLAEHGGSLIREIHNSGDLGKQSKGYGDFVTKADLTVQATCEKTLGHFFPNLKV